MGGIGGGGAGNCDGREFCVCTACDVAGTFEGAVGIKSSLRRRTFVFSGEKIMRGLRFLADCLLTGDGGGWVHCHSPAFRGWLVGRREFCVCAGCDGADDTCEGVVGIKSPLRRWTLVFSGEKIMRGLRFLADCLLTGDGGGWAHCQAPAVTDCLFVGEWSSADKRNLFPSFTRVAEGTASTSSDVPRLLFHLLLTGEGDGCWPSPASILFCNYNSVQELIFFKCDFLGKLQINLANSSSKVDDKLFFNTK